MTTLVAAPSAPVLADKQLRKPRVLFVATVVDTVRGFLLPIADHFRRMGWQVDALANSIEQDSRCQLAFDNLVNAAWSRNPLDPRNLAFARVIRQLVEDGEYNLVHVHTPVASFVTRFALESLRRKRSVQVIYTAHGFHFHPGGSMLRNFVFKSLERVAGRWTDYLVLMNREDLTAAKETKIVSSERIRYMPGIGIDRSFYSPDKVSDETVDALRLELGVSRNAPLLLMLAEFIERKRHRDAIAAFAKVRHPQAHLVLAGDGPLAAEMKQRAEKLGISGRVHFLGVRRDVPVLMRSARALLLPSEQEGLPRSILEALSMGLPVIGSSIRGTSELLEDGAGILFKAGDVDSFALAMQRLLDSEATANLMGRKGQSLSARYDLTNILSLHDELYREALGL